jgi:hypothetical protein
MKPYRFPCFLLLFLLCSGLLSAADDPIREVLKSQKPIWYDNEADDWKRIAAKAPVKKESSSVNSSNGGIGSFFAYLMIGVVAIATAWLLYQLFRNLTIDASVPLVEERRAAVARAVADLSALPFSQGDIDDPEAALAQARANHDWRKAVAWSYALHLVELDQAGILKITKGTTNRGYLRLVNEWVGNSSKRMVVPKLLADAIATFERTWFGHHVADELILQTLELGREQFKSLVEREKERSV